LNNFINTNILWVAPIFSFIVAQLLKYVVYAIQYKVFRKERLTGAGGMPSSHSSGVCTLITIMARSQGADSPMFAIALIFGLIVMYDAAGVRRAAGLHAKVINMLRLSIDELDKKNAEPSEEKPLKEFVGHTPLEVICGAILGVFIGFMIAV
jgi:acid phosphatase family membrane protein YuiD